MSKIIKDDFMIDPNIISVLQKFMGLRIDRIHEKPLLKHVKILDYYLKNPSKATYEYCKEAVDKDIPEMRTIYRHIGGLLKVGFLEPVFENQDFDRRMSKNYKKPYRLSLSGILYIILHYRHFFYRKSQRNIKELQRKPNLCPFFVSHYKSKNT